MATAKVFFRFDRSGSGWSGPFGEGSSQAANRNTAKDHAERQAWRKAQKELQGWYDTNHERFAGHNGVEVKIWVDQIVCQQCQLWIIAGVLRNLQAFAFRPKLFVEIETPVGTQMTAAVTRDYVWPVNMVHAGWGNFDRFKQRRNWDM